MKFMEVYEVYGSVSLQLEIIPTLNLYLRLVQ